MSMGRSPCKEAAPVNRKLKSIESQGAQFKKFDDVYAALISEPEEKIIYPEFKKNLAASFAENKKILMRAHSGLNDEARLLIRGDSTKLYLAMSGQF